MTFHHIISMAQDYQRQAISWLERAATCEAKGWWMEYDSYLLRGEEAAEIAEAYYIQAECHDWSKRG